jgi:hypothetical protein
MRPFFFPSATPCLLLVIEGSQTGFCPPAEGLGAHFQRDFSGFGLLASLAFVFEMQTNLWLGGLRVGRTFQLSDSRFGLNLEAGLGKIFTTRSKFASNRSLVDALGITQQLYTDLAHEVDTNLRHHGYLLTLDMLLTYWLAGSI